MEIYDVIIIGGGPAGVSAALYAVRGGASVCIVHSGLSALCKTERIENFYGAGTVDGAELYRSGIAQARALGAVIKEAQVTYAAAGEIFEVMTDIGALYSKRLVIATGAVRRAPPVEGVRQYEGKGVSYCAVCDAFFCRGKRVAVLGTGAYAKHEYDTLANVAQEVVLLTDGQAPTFDIAADSVIDKKIARVTGDGRIRAVEFDDGTELRTDALFIALGVMGSAEIARSMGVICDDSGDIIVDGRGMTNIDGLYAAGDCTPGIKQIARAVCDGMKVGLDIVAGLKEQE